MVLLMQFGSDWLVSFLCRQKFRYFKTTVWCFETLSIAQSNVMKHKAKYWTNEEICTE